MAILNPADVACFLRKAGATQAEANTLLKVVPGESSFNTAATNPSDKGCGIFQITPPEAGCYDPATNAQMALRKYRSQGRGAWFAQDSGDYTAIVAQVYSQPDCTPGGSSQTGPTGQRSPSAPFGLDNLTKAFTAGLGGILMAGAGALLVAIAVLIAASNTDTGRMVAHQLAGAAKTAAIAAALVPK